MLAQALATIDPRWNLRRPDEYVGTSGSPRAFACNQAGRNTPSEPLACFLADSKAAGEQWRGDHEPRRHHHCSAAPCRGPSRNRTAGGATGAIGARRDCQYRRARQRLPKSAHYRQRRQPTRCRCMAARARSRARVAPRRPRPAHGVADRRHRAAGQPIRALLPSREGTARTFLQPRASVPGRDARPRHGRQPATSARLLGADEPAVILVDRLRSNRG